MWPKVWPPESSTWKIVSPSLTTSPWATSRSGALPIRSTSLGPTTVAPVAATMSALPPAWSGGQSRCVVAHQEAVIVREAGELMHGDRHDGLSKDFVYGSLAFRVGRPASRA